jgi:hypothetical protein
LVYDHLRLALEPVRRNGAVHRRDDLLGGQAGGDEGIGPFGAGELVRREVAGVIDGGGQEVVENEVVEVRLGKLFFVKVQLQGSLEYPEQNECDYQQDEEYDRHEDGPEPS